jgi:hypothetical protein
MIISGREPILSGRRAAISVDQNDKGGAPVGASNQSNMINIIIIGRRSLLPIHAYEIKESWC